MKPNRDDPYWDFAPPAGPLQTPKGNLGGDLGTGFPIMETPLLVFERPLGKLPFPDLLHFPRGLFAVSDRTKRIFEDIDPSAFVFQETVVNSHDSSSAPQYWLCDIVRFVDAVDEARSRVMVETGVNLQNGEEYRRVLHGQMGKDVFRREMIGDYHLFRAQYFPAMVLLDETMAVAIRSASLLGLGLVLMGHLND